MELKGGDTTKDVVDEQTVAQFEEQASTEVSTKQ
jgi:hypothetical protein